MIFVDLNGFFCFFCSVFFGRLEGELLLKPWPIFFTEAEDIRGFQQEGQVWVWGDGIPMELQEIHQRKAPSPAKYLKIKKIGDLFGDQWHDKIHKTNPRIPMDSMHSWLVFLTHAMTTSCCFWTWWTWHVDFFRVFSGLHLRKGGDQRLSVFCFVDPWPLHQQKLKWNLTKVPVGKRESFNFQNVPGITKNYQLEKDHHLLKHQFVSSLWPPGWPLGEPSPVVPKKKATGGASVFVGDFEGCGDFFRQKIS